MYDSNTFLADFYANIGNAFFSPFPLLIPLVVFTVFTWLFITLIRLIK